MGDINIVTQPPSPNEFSQSVALPEQTQTPPAQQTSTQSSSTTEQSGAASSVDSTMEELLKTMQKSMEAMNAEIQNLKGEKVKAALAGNPDGSGSAIEEDIAEFFGYND